MKTYEIHPLAQILPEMPDAEYQQLKASIKAHGLKTPILLYEGKILDGRHRYKACVEIGIKNIPTDRYIGKCPAIHVKDLNIERRNLTPKQRAEAALKLDAAIVEESKINAEADRSAKRGRRTGKKSVALAKVSGASSKTIERVHRANKVVHALKKTAEEAEDLRTRDQLQDFVKRIEVAPSARAKEEAATEAQVFLAQSFNQAPPDAPEFTEETKLHIRKIGKLCGKKMQEDIESGVRRFSLHEIAEWADQLDSYIRPTGLLISRGYKARAAIALLHSSPCDKTRFIDTLHRAIATGGKLTGKCDGMEFELIAKDAK
jgi:ParB-like chromosome segregation protein Spo0J